MSGASWDLYVGLPIVVVIAPICWWLAGKLLPRDRDDW